MPTRRQGSSGRGTDSSSCDTAPQLPAGAPTSMTLTCSGQSVSPVCLISRSLSFCPLLSLSLSLSLSPSLLLSFSPPLLLSLSPSLFPRAPSQIPLLLVIVRRVTWMRPSSCTTRSLRTTPRTSGPTYARWDTKGGSGNLLCHRE